ncbi:MAG: hypothetical protein PHE06_15060, partial [Lachnospiraceae bacterium]|nr:hypothetical protein [Lachnospiraceae bacterium]
MGKKNKKRRKNQQNNLLVLKLLILVIIVLVIFEGRLIVTMFTQQGEIEVTSTSGTTASTSQTDETENEAAGTASAVSSQNTVAAAPLAGMTSILARQSAAVTPETETEPPVDTINSPAVVPETDPPVDDSYFSDAVFIGDSRMEGFRNASGITQGAFLTSIGLGIDGMANASISTSEGNISVYQGLSGEQYSKIYLLLGTNDLGYYPWET